MTTGEALQKVDDLRRFGTHVREGGHIGYRSREVFIDCGGIQRGVDSCLHCGEVVGMGVITVRHDDGRSVSFDPRLFHYAEAGHPITSDDIDGDTLVAIVADA